jgi:hypothetical protein
LSINKVVYMFKNHANRWSKNMEGIEGLKMWWYLYCPNRWFCSHM